ncbi:murein-DD-endopeptidase [Paraburkholderia sp. BL6665CI2N2]|uniref:serine hydrolase n=1 Tax=Paraburkholderia sp. BL6665CI2N2 TaxID=1938806 RepID=UPI00106672E4|nr:serine hydrolase [Paraburkholderia sp. BL6665CI2N2]TDY20127.1 murein-DD-endopeptidase [Paraburkholderia sp. BL6665CI2N2]
MPYCRRTPSSEFPAFRFPVWLRCFAVFGLLWLNIGGSFGAEHAASRQPSARANRHVEPSTKHTAKAKATRLSKARQPTAGKTRRRVAHKRKHVTSPERTMHVSKVTLKHRRQAARNARDPRAVRRPAVLAAKGDTQQASASRASMPHKGPRLLARCGYTPKSRALLRGRSVYVVDERTQTVLTEKQADRVMPIASVSKLMTAVVSLDAKHALNAPLNVTVQDQDFDKFTGSRLSVGATLSRHDMLHIALMSSENRAAAALSRDYTGGRPGFVAAMNAKARSLGMRHTAFVNGTGLSPQNVSTARDLSLLVAAASRYPLIRAYSTDRDQVVLPGGGRASLSYHNSNALVRGGDRSIVLQKTGFINEAGHCVVVRMKVRGRPVDIVVLGAPGAHDHIADVVRISRWLRCSLQ